MGGFVRDLGDVRRAPLTYALLGVLLVTTVTQHVVAPATAHRWLMGASTDVTNLAHRPLYALLASAAWLPGGIWPAYAVVFALVLAPVERVLGSARALVVFATGHVGATLLTEVPVAIAVTERWLPASSRTRLDVGVSYVVLVAATVLAGLLRGRRRAAMCALVVGALVVPMAWDFDLTEWGHVLAVVIGLLWWPWLRRRGRLGMLGSLRDALRHGWRREWPEAVREPVSS